MVPSTNHAKIIYSNISFALETGEELLLIFDLFELKVEER